MKCLSILFTFLCSCESIYYCENVTYKYLPNDIYVNPRKKLRKSAAKSSAPTSCYLQLYKELLLSSTVCTRSMVGDSTNWLETYNVDNQLREDWNKNFASPDCGAKIVKSSAEAKNVGHLISKSNDEYMLTECSKSVWFIVELCETIKVERFELEDHELYAGSPHHIKLSVAHKYATNSRSWMDLGNFTARGEKKVVERFDNPLQNVYGKYVKVDILSHYGDEHYCTLTSLRVYGVSEYEVLSEDDQDGDPGDHPVHIAQSSVGDKLREMSILGSSRTTDHVSRNIHSLKESFTHLYLHLRKDTCIDSVTLNVVKTTTTSISNQPDHPPKATITQSEKEAPKKKDDDITKKESILVQLNTRVKSLEKNATLMGNLIRNLNLTASIQASDMERILEAVIKAKELFKDSSKDNAAVKAKLKQFTENNAKFDAFIRETSQTIKIVVFSLIFISILIIHHACSLDNSTRLDKVQDTRDISTMTESSPLCPVSLDCDRPRRPDRRTTWCGGSQGNLAQILEVHRAKKQENKDKVLWRRVRELRDEEDGYMPSPPAVVPGVQMHPLTQVPHQEKVVQIRNNLPTIPEVLPDTGVDEMATDQPERSCSPLTILLEGGGALKSGRRRVTWCGAGSIPSSRHQQG